MADGNPTDLSKRTSRELRRKLAKHRASFGASEYTRTELLPGALKIAKEDCNIDPDYLIRVMVNRVLDDMDTADDRSRDGQSDIFDYGAHVALGAGHRIRRGRMTLDHIDRREKLIDATLAAHQAAWRIEKDWNAARKEALIRAPIGTVVEDVLHPDGTPAVSAGKPD